MTLDPHTTILDFVSLVYSDYNWKAIFRELGMPIHTDHKDIDVSDPEYFDFVYKLWIDNTPNEWIGIAIEMLVHPPNCDWLTLEFEASTETRLEILLNHWALEKPVEFVASVVKTAQLADYRVVAKDLLTTFVKTKLDEILQELLENGTISEDERNMARELSGYWEATTEQ